MVAAVLSYYCSLHMANVVSQCPGNAAFDQVTEFSDPFAVFWGPRAYTVTQILFFLTAIVLNVAAMVDTAQVELAVVGGQLASQLDDKLDDELGTLVALYVVVLVAL